MPEAEPVVDDWLARDIVDHRDGDAFRIHVREPGQCFLSNPFLPQYKFDPVQTQKIKCSLKVIIS